MKTKREQQKAEYGQETKSICTTHLKTASGIYFDLNNPQEGDVVIEDIAKALSKICRYGGHCPHYYSVAEHSVNVAHILSMWDAPRDAMFAGLMHDAAEAYVGDMITALKGMVSGYKQIEKSIDDVIRKKFGIEAWDHLVAEADLAALIAEKRQMWPKDKSLWINEEMARPVNVKLRYYPPSEAYISFMDSYIALHP